MLPVWLVLKAKLDEDDVLTSDGLVVSKDEESSENMFLFNPPARINPRLLSVAKGFMATRRGLIDSGGDCGTKIPAGPIVLLGGPLNPFWLASPME